MAPMIPVTCGKCGTSDNVPNSRAGKTLACSACGASVVVPADASARMPDIPVTRVVVADVAIPAGRMVVLLLGWAVAAIPAILLLRIAFAFIDAIFLEMNRR